MIDFAPQVQSYAEPVANDGLLLLSRSYCYLCDEMLAALHRLKVFPTVVDVDADPALVALWDEKVPVLLLNGVEVCHYHLDERALRALLDVK